MRKTYYNFYSALNQRLIDALSAGIAFCLAYQIRFEWHIPPDSAYQMWLLLPGVMLGHVLVSSSLGTYRLIWRYVGLPDALIVARNHAAFSAMLLALRICLPPQYAILRIPVSVIVVELMLSLAGAIGARVLRRLQDENMLGWAVPGRAAKRVLLVGAGSAGVRVIKEIAPHADMKPVGFVDDDPRKMGAVIGGLRVLGPICDLPAIITEYGIHEVIICIPRVPRAILKLVWAACELLDVRARIVPTLEEILQGTTSIAAFRQIDTADLLGREPFTLSLNDPQVVAAYAGKRILITGAGGSIGAELAFQLSRLAPHDLILLDKDENGLHAACLRIQAERTGIPLYPVIADLRFATRLQRIFSDFRPEVVFHAAAHKHVHLMELNPCEAVLNNVIGTRNLVEQSLKVGVSRFVLISTDKAVRPTSIMGASKRLCEMIVQAHNGGSHFSCVRFGNVVGSHGSVVPIFQKQIARGGPVTLTHPEVKRFLMTIPEAVSLLIQAGTLESGGDIFVLEMGEPVLIRDLARDLIELSGLRPADIPIAITGLRGGEKLSEDLVDPATEKLLPTSFEKIRVIRSQPFDLGRLTEKLAAIEQAALQNSPEAIFQILLELNIGFQPSEAMATSAPTVGKGEARAYGEMRSTHLSDGAPRRPQLAAQRRALN
jgi:FlaA1/EpsC-like NDP-sugar epimerase